MSRAVRILDGALVREELDRLGESQRSFARRYGLRESQLSRALRGHPVDLETIVVVARALGRAAEVAG